MLRPVAEPMDLRFFFEGTIRREEIASAFVATLLQYNPPFRKLFLTVALGSRVADEMVWTVRVEAPSSAQLRLQDGVELVVKAQPKASFDISAICA